jgi:hypothetical protein
MRVTESMKRLLSEAAGGSYFEMLKDTDAAFLEKVAAILKKRHGKKFEELRVHKGISTVFLAFKGQDKGDIDIDGFVALSTQSWTDVNVVLEAKHAMRGRIDRTVPYKTGVLTPEAVADIVSEQMGK